MARLIQQLTEAKIRALTVPRLHPDGAGLLQISPAVRGLGFTDLG